MVRVGILFFVFSSLFVSKSFAFTCTVYPNRVEVGIGKFETKLTHDICEKEIIMNHRLGTVIVLSSYGGFVREVPSTLMALDKILQMTKAKKVGLPVVVVREYCMSACIPILAAFNKLATRGELFLIVDSRTRIGFHGASIPYDAKGLIAEEDAKIVRKEYSSLGTLNYLHISTILGIQIPWLIDHAEYFASDDGTFMLPDDARL